MTMRSVVKIFTIVLSLCVLTCSDALLAQKEVIKALVDNAPRCDSDSNPTDFEAFYENWLDVLQNSSAYESEDSEESEMAEDQAMAICEGLNAGARPEKQDVVLVIGLCNMSRCVPDRRALDFTPEFLQELRRYGVRVTWKTHVDGLRSTHDQALQLKADIDRICRSKGEPCHLTLIGYSDGGLVARYYVNKFDVDDRINFVLLMNTPNLGTSFLKPCLIQGLLGFCGCPEPARESLPESMVEFNKEIQDKKGVTYRAVSSGELGFGFWGILFSITNLLLPSGQNDGVVTVASHLSTEGDEGGRGANFHYWQTNPNSIYYAKDFVLEADGTIHYADINRFFGRNWGYNHVDVRAHRLAACFTARILP
jgi:hypothetical protein